MTFNYRFQIKQTIIQAPAATAILWTSHNFTSRWAEKNPTSKFLFLKYEQALGIRILPLTFTARASYRLGRHLNTSALPQARASHTLGQPQPQPFKYFALNIFREISLILSPRSFSSFMLLLIYHVSIFYMRLFVHKFRLCIAYFFCSIRSAGEWLIWSSGVRDHTLFGL